MRPLESGQGGPPSGPAGPGLGARLLAGHVPGGVTQGRGASSVLAGQGLARSAVSLVGQQRVTRDLLLLDDRSHITPRPLPPSVLQHEFWKTPISALWNNHSHFCPSPSWGGLCFSRCEDGRVSGARARVPLQTWVLLSPWVTLGPPLTQSGCPPHPWPQPSGGLGTELLTPPEAKAAASAPPGGVGP